MTEIVQFGLLRKVAATVASNAFWLSFNLVELPVKAMLGKFAKTVAQSPPRGPLQSGQVESGQITGHFPTPSTSTG